MTTVTFLDDLAGGFDLGPDYEWQREMTEEFRTPERPLFLIYETPAVPASVPAAVPQVKTRCQKCGYLKTWCPCPGGPRA